MEPSSLRELQSASLPQGMVRLRGEGCVVSENLGLSWQVITTEALYVMLAFSNFLVCCVTLHLFPQFERVMCVFSSSLVSCVSGEGAC